MKPDKPMADWTLNELLKYCEAVEDCTSCIAEHICGDIPLMWDLREEADE